MRRTMDKLLRRYGTRLVLQRQGENIPICGFLQHASAQSWQNTELDFSPLGRIPGGHYLFIGPVMPMSEGDVLVENGKSYVIRRLETVIFRNRPVYLWGLCVEKGGEDAWGS